MIIASATSRDKKKKLLIIGLSDENIHRLSAGQPIFVSRESHGLAVPENLAISIFVGETEESMRDYFIQQGLIGPDTITGQKKPYSP